MINESHVASVKHISRVFVATVIAFLFIIGIFATNAFAALVSEYNVTINDNGKEYAITTNETEPIDILEKANITLGSNDKLDISSFDEGKGGTISIDRLNTVNVQFNGTIKTYSVYADTVEDLFTEIGIDIGECSVNYSGKTAVENGMVLTVDSKTSVTLNADGKTYNYSAISGTVKDILSLAGITLNGEDYVEPSQDEKLTDDMTINVFRVETKTVTETESIDFKTIKKDDDSIDAGKTETETKGTKGSKNVTYKVTYVNGEESKKDTISETVTKEAKDEVMLVGTKPVAVAPNGVQTYGSYSVGQTISGRYTHYCCCKKCCGKTNGITSSGIKVYNGMTDMHYIACNWLPLGSVVNVRGTDYTVVDRGGSGLSSRGRIDIFTPEGHQAAIRGGTGSCTMEIVRLGW